MAKNDTTQQTSAPIADQSAYYKDLWSKANTAFDATNGKTFDGSLYAGPNQVQKTANQQVIDAAPGLSAGADPLRKLALSQINGDWLSPDTNPFIKDVASAALKPLQTNFTTALGSIGDKAIMQGAYGGARQDIQQNQALDQFNRASGDITSGIYGQNYANERQIQQNSGNLLDQSNLLALAGPTALASAGSQQQGWDQAALDAALKKWQMDQQAPWSGTSEMANILQSGGFGTTSKTTDKGTNSSILGALQGLMGGASTGASLATGIGGVAAGAGLGAFAPWMLPIAALGGLAGAL